MFCHAKSGPPYLVPPSPYIISKYLDPLDNFFKFAEFFGPPELKFLKCLDPLEINILSPLIFNVQRGYFINLKYWIP